MPAAFPRALALAIALAVGSAPESDADCTPPAASEPPQSASPLQDSHPQAVPPVELHGNGRFTSQPFALEAGLTLAAAANSGANNLIVHLYDEHGKKVVLLFNEIGPYQGSRGFEMLSAGQFVAEVQADGDWSLTLRQPRPTGAPAKLGPTTGRGYTFTEFVQLEPGLHTLKFTHTGEGMFKAVLHNHEGHRLESVVHVEGNYYDGVQPLRIEKAGIYFLNVRADGDWTIAID